MTAVYPKFEKGPVTFKAAEAIAGGQVVEIGEDPRTAKPAGADSAKVIGVAIQDADPEGPTTHTAVAHTPAQICVDGDGAAAVGDLVKAAADGKVAKADPAADTTEKIVGRVIEVLADNKLSIRLYV